MQILTPRVKYCQEADGGTQQPRVCCGFQQSSGGGVKEDVVNRFGILQRQAANLLGQREHYVKIGDRQEFRLPLRQPAGASRGLAFWAVAIPTRVIQEDTISAPVALPEMATQGRGPAVANVFQRSPLWAGQHVVPASQEILLMSAEDIGQFQPMIVHRWIAVRSSDSNQSNGLMVERTLTSATCR
jgi:hypothetical protein